MPILVQGDIYKSVLGGGGGGGGERDRDITYDACPRVLIHVNVYCPGFFFFFGGGGGGVGLQLLSSAK